MIGAGAVGENVADRVVRGGLTAVLIEAELVGGECSYWACMPSKALLRPGTALHGAQTVPGAQEAVTRTLDAAAVLKRRDYFTSNWQDDGQVKWVEDTGIELIRGHGWITAPRQVEVAGKDGNSYALTARHAVVVATGSTPNQPPVEGLSRRRVLDHQGGDLRPHGPGAACGTRRRGGRRRTRPGLRPPWHVRDSRGPRQPLGIFPEQAADLVAAGLRADGVDLRLHSPERARDHDGHCRDTTGTAVRATLRRRHGPAVSYGHGGQAARHHWPAPRPRGARPGQRRASAPDGRDPKARPPIPLA